MPVHVVVTGKIDHRGSDGLRFLTCLRAAASQAWGTKISLCVTGLPTGLKETFPEFVFHSDSEPKYNGALLENDLGGRSLRFQSTDFLACVEDVLEGALVLRLRVDMPIVSVQRLVCFLQDYTSVSPRLGRLWVAAEGTRNTSIVPVPLFFSDLIQFGLKEQLVKFWQGAQEYERTQTISPRSMLSPSFMPGLPRPLAPEQFSYGTFLLERTPSSTHKSPKLVDFRTTLRAIGSEIVVVPLASLGLGLPPNWIPAEWVTRRFVFSSLLEKRQRFLLARTLLTYVHAKFLFWMNPLWWRMGRYPISRDGGKLIWTYSRYNEARQR